MKKGEKCKFLVKKKIENEHSIVFFPMAGILNDTLLHLIRFKADELLSNYIIATQIVKSSTVKFLEHLEAFPKHIFTFNVDADINWILHTTDNFNDLFCSVQGKNHWSITTTF